MQTVVQTPDFIRDASDARLSEDEVTEIQNLIAADPTIGDLMPGTGGARKIRIAGRGKGKRGGYRVVTYFGGDDIPVFLLALFSKGEKENLSKAERNELQKELAGLAADYRASVRKTVIQFKSRSRK